VPLMLSAFRINQHHDFADEATKATNQLLQRRLALQFSLPFGLRRFLQTLTLDGGLAEAFYGAGQTADLVRSVHMRDGAGDVALGNVGDATGQIGQGTQDPARQQHGRGAERGKDKKRDNAHRAHPGVDVAVNVRPLDAGIKRPGNLAAPRIDWHVSRIIGLTENVGLAGEKLACKQGRVHRTRLVERCADSA